MVLGKYTITDFSEDDVLRVEGRDDGDGVLDRSDFSLDFSDNPFVKGVTINFNDAQQGSVVLKNVALDDLQFDDVTGEFTIVPGEGNL